MPSDKVLQTDYLRRLSDRLLWACNDTLSMKGRVDSSDPGFGYMTQWEFLKERSEGKILNKDEALKT